MCIYNFNMVNSNYVMMVFEASVVGLRIYFFKLMDSSLYLPHVLHSLCAFFVTTGISWSSTNF